MALVCRDRFYVLYQKQSTWEVLSGTDELTSMRQTSELRLTSLKSSPSSANANNHLSLVTLQDGKTLLAHSELGLMPTKRSPSQLSLPRADKLHKMIIEEQRSLSLFHPSLLAELFYKGYGDFVVKILLKLNDILAASQDQSEGSKARLSDYLDMDLESLLLELKAQAEQLALATASGGQPEVKQPAGK